MSKRALLLKSGLIPTSTLRSHLAPGMSALKKADRSLVDQSQHVRIGDSIDLDTAMKAAYPNAHRWDYVVSVPDARKLIAIEPHSMADGEIKELIAKKQNALQYLDAHLAKGVRVSEWHWVTRGKVGFSVMDRAKRALDKNGITFSGRKLKHL